MAGRRGTGRGLLNVLAGLVIIGLSPPGNICDVRAQQPAQQPVPHPADQPAQLPPLPANPAPASEGPSPAPPRPLGRAIGSGRAGTSTSPGLPPSSGRPRPGGVLDPGASGPGVGTAADEDFLGGALNVRTGWPFVFLDHFQPRPERVANLWVVQTRDCPQEMGADPWPRIKFLQFDAEGNLVQHDPTELFAQAVGRPVIIQTHGSLVTADAAVGEILWSHTWLEHNRALPPGAVVIEFDWPSQRIYRNNTRDINEKGRRAFVAGYHLARFVQAFPAGSRVCLLGQSYGGRVVPAALHLLAGGSLDSQSHDGPVRLAGCRADIELHAILVEGASDHNWLNPDERFDRALLACRSLLNLYNSKDEALRMYPLLRRSGHRRALGRIGLTNADFEKLGPVAARYQEHDVHDLLGNEHTLLDAVANRQIARWMAPYLGAADPGPSPNYPNLFRERPDRTPLFGQRPANN